MYLVIINFAVLYSSLFIAFFVLFIKNDDIQILRMRRILQPIHYNWVMNTQYLFTFPPYNHMIVPYA